MGRKEDPEMRKSRFTEEQISVPGEKVVSLTQGDFLDARTGIYFYRLEVGNQVMSRKLMLVH